VGLGFAVEGEQVEDRVRRRHRAVAVQQSVADQREIGTTVSEGDDLAVERCLSRQVAQLGQQLGLVPAPT
jgi:hypothetical protein